MKPNNPAGLHPHAAELLAFWCKAKGDAILPNRRFLDPLVLRRWINDLSIVEYREGRKNYFVRLQSEDIQNRIGQNLSRTFFEDTLSSDSLPVALAPYQKTRETRLPTHSLMTPRLYPGLFSSLERLVLPFTDNDAASSDAQVDRFLTWVGSDEHASEQPKAIYGLIPQKNEHDLDDTMQLSVFAA